MKRLLVFTLVTLTLILLLSSCGYSEAELTEARNAGYDKGSKAGYDEGYKAGQASAIQAPEGSVIEDRVVWNISYTYGTNNETYTRLHIYVKVMNVGDDGSFTVHVELEPRPDYPDDKVLEPRHQTTRIYLKTAEEKELRFDFWAKGGFLHREWCTSP